MAKTDCSMQFGFVTAEAPERREDNTHRGTETASALILVGRGCEQNFIDRKALL